MVLTVKVQAEQDTLLTANMLMLACLLKVMMRMEGCDTAVRQVTITCFPTGSTLGPEVQIKVQVLHHVSELVVVRILSELNTETTRSEHRQSRGLGNAQQLFPKNDFSLSDGCGRKRARQPQMRSVFKI